METKLEEENYFLTSLKFGAEVQEATNIIPAPSEESRILEYRRRKRVRRQEKEHRQKQVLKYKAILKELDEALEKEDRSNNNDYNDEQQSIYMFYESAPDPRRNYGTDSLYRH